MQSRLFAIRYFFFTLFVSFIPSFSFLWSYTTFWLRVHRLLYYFLIIYSRVFLCVCVFVSCFVHCSILSFLRSLTSTSFAILYFRYPYNSMLCIVCVETIPTVTFHEIYSLRSLNGKFTGLIPLDYCIENSLEQ